MRNEAATIFRWGHPTGKAGKGKKEASMKASERRCPHITGCRGSSGVTERGALRILCFHSRSRLLDEAALFYWSLLELIRWLGFPAHRSLLMLRHRVGSFCCPVHDNTRCLPLADRSGPIRQTWFTSRPYVGKWHVLFAIFMGP
jgi:hypothetical protein